MQEYEKILMEAEDRNRVVNSANQMGRQIVIQFEVSLNELAESLSHQNAYNFDLYRILGYIYALSWSVKSPAITSAHGNTHLQNRM